MSGVLIFHKKRDHSDQQLFVHEKSELAIVCDVGAAKRMLRDRHICLILIHLERYGDEGMRLAMDIRDMPNYYFTPIIFLAWDDTQKERALHLVHCYDYLIKPIKEMELLYIIYPYIRSVYIEPEWRQLRFRIHGDTYVANLRDVIYMQCNHRSVEIHTTRGVLAVPYLNFQNFVRQCGNWMLRCHRLTAVNRSYIKKIDYAEKKIELWGADVDIGRGFLESVREEYEDSLAW